jgi:hypothetical protein
LEADWDGETNFSASLVVDDCGPQLRYTRKEPMPIPSADISDAVRALDNILDFTQKNQECRDTSDSSPFKSTKISSAVRNIPISKKKVRARVEKDFYEADHTGLREAISESSLLLPAIRKTSFRSHPTTPSHSIFTVANVGAAAGSDDISDDSPKRTAAELARLRVARRMKAEKEALLAKEEESARIAVELQAASEM